MGSSCFARGNEEHLQLIETYLEKHQLTAEVELYGSRCEGQCSHGPNLEIDGIIYNGVTPDKLTLLLNEHLRVEV
jgi:NADH:ubiquinone oxidoreductase subunit E